MDRPFWGFGDSAALSIKANRLHFRCHNRRMPPVVLAGTMRSNERCPIKAKASGRLANSSLPHPAIVHPNVVPVLDASVSGFTPYLVMPRIEGPTMQQHLATAFPPLPVALWLVRQTAQALDAIHTAGWVHGDVKPDNVIVGPRGHVTLIDFGFASRVHSVPSHVYRGTPDYSAPETLAGQSAMMPAMDIFSLGRLLWQWLARTEPTRESLIEPAAGLVEQMVSIDPTTRPKAGEVANQLLRLEIETLGCHIVPTQMRRAA